MKPRSLRFLLGGASGFVGQNVINRLKQAGHTFDNISRTAGVTSMKKYSWDQLKDKSFKFPDYDAVVNFAGVNLMENPIWTPGFEKQVVSSRVDSTKAIAELLSDKNRMANPPKVWINSSAVGYYPTGVPGPEVDENWPEPDPGFLGQLSALWEQTADITEEQQQRLKHPIRILKFRYGMVLGRDGGALQSMIRPFKFGFGGHIMPGKQAYPWVHVGDIWGMIEKAVEDERMKGIYNLVAPETTDAKKFAQVLASTMDKSSWCHVPGFAVKMLLGKVRGNMLTTGSRVIPKRTLESGYEFKFPTLEAALNDILK